MTRLLLTGLLALALAPDAPTVVAPADAQPTALSHKASRVHERRAAHKRDREPAQIACTFDGCHRVPARCHPETGYTSSGLPTGYDIVVCP
jgi:hypothetical protein